MYEGPLLPSCAPCAVCSTQAALHNGVFLTVAGLSGVIGFAISFSSLWFLSQVGCAGLRLQMRVSMGRRGWQCGLGCVVVGVRRDKWVGVRGHVLGEHA